MSEYIKFAHFDDIFYKTEEQLKDHTTFRVGGPAKLFFEIDDINKLKMILSELRSMKEKYIIIGNGSNIIFSDQGYDGAVIEISKGFNGIRIFTNALTQAIEDDEVCIEADAGAMLSKVASFALDNELTGMEFASGIPGTIGGAIVMNAGAYGGEMKDIVKSVTVLNSDGDIVEYSLEQMEFGYRKSIITSDMVVLKVVLALKKGEKEKIYARMKELNEARRSKQPLEYPSAGSTFKRPKGYFAGKLIEDSGLKGYRVGGAMVSTKHCGFVVNYDNATSEDIVNIIQDVKKIVFERFGVLLEPEVKIIR